VQRLLIDAPSYDYENKKESKIKLTEDNADEVYNLLNSM
jgi:hypothetical protein